MNIRSLLISCGAVLASSAAGLALAEVGLRAVHPQVARHYVRAPGTAISSTPRAPYVTGVRPRAHFQVNRDGVRGSAFAPRQYRVLAIGGSTTELLYNDAPHTWTALLERALGQTSDGRAAWVGNVGRSGNAVREHVLQFDQLTREYPEIDAVTMLVGINDAALAMAGATIDLPAAVQFARAFEVFPGDSRDPAYKRAALYRLARRIRARRTGTGAIQDSVGAWMADARRHRRDGVAIDTMPDISRYLTAYREDLEHVATLARARNIRLVLLTQPSLVRETNTPDEDATLWFGAAEVDRAGGKAATRYYTRRIVAQVLSEFNAITMDVCRTAEVECLDLAAQLEPSSALFYDDVHFTDSGAVRVADELTQFLRRSPPFEVRAGSRRVTADDS